MSLCNEQNIRPCCGLGDGSTADAIDTYQLGFFVVLDSTLIMLWRQKAYNTRFDIVINEYSNHFLIFSLHIILFLIMDIGVWVGAWYPSDNQQHSTAQYSRMF